MRGHTSRFVPIFGAWAARRTTRHVHNLVVYNGCSGTSAGFGALCEGQTVDYCVERMEGILCHGSNGSSCPDQSAKALATAQALINGTLCENCGLAE